MKNRYSMQKIVSILCALILLVSCFGVFSACQPKHTCQSVCQDCGKCTNANCVEKACAVKCPGHHVCESLCPTCNNCTDADCVEAVCANKCAGHHSCTSQCEKCGKCQDLACTETVCAYKCVGHHVCEDPCPICGKCVHSTTDPEYKYNKCKGHETCLSPCPRCGNCTKQKCTFPNQHITCDCGYPWYYYDHMCTNVCNICGACTNSECTQQPCASAQCPGHDTPPEITLLDEPVTEYTYIPLTAEEEAMLKQAFVDYRISIGFDKDYIEPVTIESYYGKIGNSYILEMRGVIEVGFFENDLYYTIDGIVLPGSHRYEIFVYENGALMPIDKAYENKLLTYDELIVASHYMCANSFMKKMERNGEEVTFPIKINPVARVDGKFFYYVGEDISTYDTLTRSYITVDNIAFDKVQMDCWFKESVLYYTYGHKDDYIKYTWEFWEIQNYLNYYLQQKGIVVE